MIHKNAFFFSFQPYLKRFDYLKVSVYEEALPTRDHEAVSIKDMQEIGK